MGLVTGCFSLVGIQEVISYEYIYKLTQYNVVPDTPVSSNAEGSVPEGWSSQLLGVSASLPYLWESRRQKKDSYVTRDLSSSSFTRNYWIGTNGVASYSNGYSYSEVFDLPSGQTIEVLTAGTGFSVISKYSNRSYTPIVKASGSVSEQKMYTYTADTDCQIVVSVYHLSTYSVKITSGTWGAWSTPTLKNSWGKQGAKMRMRTWESGVDYMQGTDGEEFYDIVVYETKLYLCTKTHTSSSSNNPIESIESYLGYWESAQQWTFIATQLLLAGKIVSDKITADLIDADGITAKDVKITGEINATSGTFNGVVKASAIYTSLRVSRNESFTINPSVHGTAFIGTSYNGIAFTPITLPLIADWEGINITGITKLVSRNDGNIIFKAQGSDKFIKSITETYKYVMITEGYIIKMLATAYGWMVDNIQGCKFSNDLDTWT